MSNQLNLLQHKFDRLLVTRQLPNNKYGKTMWECICDCGNVTIAVGSALNAGRHKSCGKCNIYYILPQNIMVCEVKSGVEFYFDMEDYEIISKYVWHINKNRVYTKRDKKPCVLHRILFNIYDSKIQADHKDGNPLNNCKNNLRVCTNSQNAKNSCKPKGEHSSKYKGVDWCKNRWRSRIKNNYQEIVIGYFTSEREAAKAYNTKAKELFGEYAKLNIIQVGDYYDN